MASIEKFVDAAVVNQLRHCNREIKNDKNKDIDPDRTKWNLSLTPEREMGEYEYYKARKKELYCYGRADVKTMCGWIITAPQELGKAHGVVFGKKGMKVVYSPSDQEGHIVCMGGSGVGKTSSLLIPTLRSWDNIIYICIIMHVL